MESEPWECFVSLASIWEAAIKIGLGKLKLPYSLNFDLPHIMENNGFKKSSRNNVIQDAQEFCLQPRHDEGAYPLWSVTEEQRWMAAKEQADSVM